MSEDHTNLIFQKQANIGTFFWATVCSSLLYKWTSEILNHMKKKKKKKKLTKVWHNNPWSQISAQCSDPVVWESCWSHWEQPCEPLRLFENVNWGLTCINRQRKACWCCGTLLEEIGLVCVPINTWLLLLLLLFYFNVMGYFFFKHDPGKCLSVPAQSIEKLCNTSCGKYKSADIREIKTFGDNLHDKEHCVRFYDETWRSYLFGLFEVASRLVGAF